MHLQFHLPNSKQKLDLTILTAKGYVPKEICLKSWNKT